MVLPANDRNSMDGMCGQQRRKIRKTNKLIHTIIKRERDGERDNISRIHNENGGLGQLDTHRTY